MLSTLESAQLEAGENPTDVAYRLAHDILDGEPLPDNLDAKLRSDAILEAERLRVEERHIVQPGDTVTLHVTFDDGEPYDLDVEIAVTDESTPENK